MASVGAAGPVRTVTAPGGIARARADRARGPPTRRGRAGARPPRGVGAAAHHPRSSNDLGFELYREATLLLILAARLAETADALDRGAPVDPARLRRALDVHHRFLIDVRRADLARLERALATVSSARAALARWAEERAHPFAFERAVADRWAGGLSGRGPAGAALARLFREEARRLEAEAEWEEENLPAHLDRWLPRTTQGRLLREIRAFDTARVAAEIDLISWASQVHPSSD